jgi:hypothetical protein
MRKYCGAHAFLPVKSPGLAWPDDRPLVLNLAPCHETAVRPLGVGRYYLLE